VGHCSKMTSLHDYFFRRGNAEKGGPSDNVIYSAHRDKTFAQA